ncbi:uncharacterized protein LOC129587089 isoform X2 [Paramacrobiotus metropolitanus]|uniref:uncharacterized protein LOC129587089 isoform X2 n=1 Tax=Paramacrobiotus metropolitanus TaxID=2943436 RepID=UPI002445EB8E|nr:uncharacterized protein LOC129587089 isoform X2 [Paramacrobiotus metropolitanus]
MVSVLLAMDNFKMKFSRAFNGGYAVVDSKMFAQRSDHDANTDRSSYSYHAYLPSHPAAPPTDTFVSATAAFVAHENGNLSDDPHCTLQFMEHAVGLMPWSTSGECESFTTMAVADAPSYGHDDERDDENEDEDDDYVNGDHDSHGSPPNQRQGSDSTEQPNRFANFNLKRCRFAPRQDIELLKEIINQDDKPYNASGKSSWEVWGKIAHNLNNKQIFGPVLSLSALTCKLRFDFLLKNFGGHAMKYNPKRGTLDEFQKRDELLAQIIPDVPARDDEMSFGSGKRRRGRPRKLRDHFSPQNDDDDGDMMDDEHPLRHSMRHAAHLAAAMQAQHAPSGSAQLPLAQNPFLHHYMAAQAASQQQAAGIPEGSMVSMLTEYFKRHHESDLQFKREELEARQREKSEERRLEREQMEMKKAEMDLRRAELALQQQKWQVEREERQMNLELMKKKILKL